jgi:RNA polymerase sigma-70 factor, ECF subfamily
LDITDEQLFENYRKGDKTAIRTLIERFHDDLMRFLTRLVGERAGAEDVFQETFLQIHQAADTFDATRRFRPWLFTIAANKGRDFLRRRGRRRTLDLSAPVSGGGDEGGATEYIDLMEVRIPAPDAGMESDEQSRQVQQALNELPVSLREILLLAYFQRLSYAQIAEDLEIPLGTVKSRLHAAVAAFAKRWNLLSGGGGSQ